MKNIFKSIKFYFMFIELPSSLRGSCVFVNSLIEYDKNSAKNRYQKFFALFLFLGDKSVRVSLKM